MKPKAGITTTEFWILMLGSVLIVLVGVRIDAGLIYFSLDMEAVKWWLVLALGYTAQRGYVKGAVSKNASSF